MAPTLNAKYQAAQQAGWRVGQRSLLRVAPTLTAPAAKALAGELGAAMHVCHIDTPRRAAMFLATVSHESLNFLYRREIWGPTAAQSGYEGRRDLGNTVKGDGKRFMGRGFIQITGRHNYLEAGRALGLDLVGRPELLERRDLAVLSAAWWWMDNGCNHIADTGDFLAVSRKVNLGSAGSRHTPNGWDDRRRRYGRTLGVRRYLVPRKAAA